MGKITASFRITLQLFKRFKFICALDGCSMSERLEAIIKKDVEEYQEEKKIKIL